MVHSDSNSLDNSRNDWKNIINLTHNKAFNPHYIDEDLDFTQKSVFLPLNKATMNLKGLDPVQLYLQLKQSSKYVIFLKNLQLERNKLIIKFTGKEDYISLIDDLAAKVINPGSSAIIISPIQLTKNYRQKEAMLVKKASSVFKETYFIKLPLYSLNEYLEYAHNEKGSIMLLPFSDLLPYIELIKAPQASKRIESAVFLPAF